MPSRSTLKSPQGIVRYANVFTPRQRKDDKGVAKGDPKYNILLVFNKKADLTEMEEEIERAAVEKFGTKAMKLLETGKLRSPIRDADEYIDEDKGEEDNFPFNLPGARMVRFSTADKPAVFDVEADPIMEKSDFYDGCMARVSYRCYAYDREGNKGVGIALINVQKLEDGEKLGGSNPNGEEFKEDQPKGKAKAKPAARGRKPTTDDDDDMV